MHSISDFIICWIMVYVILELSDWSANRKFKRKFKKAMKKYESNKEVDPQIGTISGSAK